MRKRIAAERLRVGMYVDELCGSWMQHPFWATSFHLNDPADIARILDSGIEHVWIDTAKGVDAADPAADEDERPVEDVLLGAVDGEPAPLAVSFEDEVRRARQIVESSREAVAAMFGEARMGAIRASDAYRLVDDIGASVARNPDAIISIARLKRADQYTYMHSVAVCALMTALAAELGLDQDGRREAGQAGLLHDVGKVHIPAAVLNKPGRLTDEEFALIKTHPMRGHELLRQSSGVGEIALDACLHHHEKTDGRGYPDGLAGPAIGLHARMAAVCDVYDAITSDRPYKKGWDPAIAIRKMAEWLPGHFDEVVFRAFVKCVGIYPIGSVVRLESGRLAVVAGKTASSLLKPPVVVFYSTRAHMHLAPQRIDLSLAGATDAIAGPEDVARWKGAVLHVPRVHNV